MAPARRARSPGTFKPVYADAADATDDESEQETPRPQKGTLKKRLSEVYHPDNDNSETGRPPLRAVNINDDAAEKRRRRKSTKIHVIENSLAGPSSEGAQEQESQEPSRGAKQKPLQTVAPPVANVSWDIMSSNFEEWMKLATDNKINPQNSWNFALIDYFHDMSLLRNNDDNSINFQRASTTLDGCVKIWTSRVDSVGTETGKLLSNLVSGRRDLEEDDNAENSDNPDADPTQAKKRKTNRGTGATLAKDPSALKNKKPDLEFAVDPLFKKTCADFDEGGASGLLMNHLSLGIGSEGCMRVIFDASDSMGKVEDEDVVEEPEDLMDMTFLRKEYFPDLSVLENKTISHSLADFEFAKNAFTLGDSTMFLDNTRHEDDIADEDDDNFGTNMDAGEVPTAEDFFVGADAVNDDFGGDFGGDDDFGDDPSHNGSVGPSGEIEEGRPGPFVPFDPRRAPTERDLKLVMADPNSEGGALDYFDQNFLKNWAGPEHWKLRKNIRKPEATADANKANKRQKKEAVKIDFMTPSDKDLKELAKEIFAPVTKGVGINLPGTGTTANKKGAKKKKEKRDDHRLPDDMHFASRQLVTLFTKPKFSLKMRGRRVRINDNDGEVDETNGEPVPFNTQFFHDDDFGPGFDDDGGGLPDEDSGEQDLLAATQGQTRRVRPEFVNYTKRAKRVDVRKLKDNIWKGLDIVVDNKKSSENDESMDVDEPEVTPTDPSDSRQFSQVISGLQKSYPKDKMDEISTSFCFICLLHLANEQGLKLESAAEESPMAEKELVIDEAEDEIASDDKKIGNIWDIKIYRDPNATQSA
ncbi:condensin complex subunit 2/barren [Gymnopilus junonius]|uniref:Condensin complex subunit 2 n=1 Tax=Gymnopilus junonius TaxID=109634 RepID=A0A9P5TLM5_GYMJU|nr:condensin complex subunit 2/barren [Gymnopilus junonius]